jgi:hypothetical protein
LDNMLLIIVLLLVADFKSQGRIKVLRAKIGSTRRLLFLLIGAYNIDNCSIIRLWNPKFSTKSIVNAVVRIGR